MGVSEALYIPAGLSLIADFHSDKTRSLAIGIHMTGLYTGQAIGGFGATIASLYSWQITFHWFGLIGIVYSLILILFLKDIPKPKAKLQSAAVSRNNKSPFKGIVCLIGLSGLFYSISLHPVFRDGLPKTGFQPSLAAIFPSKCLKLVHFLP